MTKAIIYSSLSIDGLPDYSVKAYRNPQFFVKVERGYNVALTDRDDIREAYEAAGVEVSPLPGVKAEAKVEPKVEAEKPDPLGDLKAQATELNIQFDGRWGEAKLQSAIDEALAAPSDPSGTEAAEKEDIAPAV